MPVRKNPPRISVVVPVHNEEHSIQELAARLRKAVREPVELVIVDDGSTDYSRDAALRLRGDVQVISFEGRRGKSAALMEGFRHARGESIVTIDGDLQDLPEEVPELIHKLYEGWDLVSGWKVIRRDPLGKKLPSKLFNLLIRKIAGLEIHDINCGLKAYRGELARSLRLRKGYHRFIPLVAHAQGWRVCEIPVKHQSRLFGESKYGIGRLVPGFLQTVLVLAAFYLGRRGSFTVLRQRAENWLNSVCSPKEVACDNAQEDAIASDACRSGR